MEATCGRIVQIGPHFDLGRRTLAARDRDCLWRAGQLAAEKWATSSTSFASFTFLTFLNLRATRSPTLRAQRVTNLELQVQLELRELHLQSIRNEPQLCAEFVH